MVFFFTVQQWVLERPRRGGGCPRGLMCVWPGGWTGGRGRSASPSANTRLRSRPLGRRGAEGTKQRTWHRPADLPPEAAATAPAAAGHGWIESIAPQVRPARHDGLGWPRARATAPGSSSHRPRPHGNNLKDRNTLQYAPLAPRNVGKGGYQSVSTPFPGLFD